MKKKAIIQKIMETVLEPYGVKWLKFEGQEYIFKREVKGIKRYYAPEIDVVNQYITIQQHRFAKTLTLRFSTDVWNRLVGKELEVLKELNNQDTMWAHTCWFQYTDEESFEDYRLALELKPREAKHIFVLELGARPTGKEMRKENF